MQITDTGAFRSPWHTSAGDTEEKLDFEALARITLGLRSGIVELTTVEGLP